MRRKYVHLVQRYICNKIFGFRLVFSRYICLLVIHVLELDQTASVSFLVHTAHAVHFAFIIGLTLISATASRKGCWGTCSPSPLLPHWDVNARRRYCLVMIDGVSDKRQRWRRTGTWRCSTGCRQWRRLAGDSKALATRHDQYGTPCIQYAPAQALHKHDLQLRDARYQQTPHDIYCTSEKKFRYSRAFVCLSFCLFVCLSDCQQLHQTITDLISIFFLCLLVYLSVSKG